MSWRGVFSAVDMYALAKHSPLFLYRIFHPAREDLVLQRSGSFLPHVHTTCRVGFGVLSVKPGCHTPGSIRNLLVYLPPAQRVKKTRYSMASVSEAESEDSPECAS